MRPAKREGRADGYVIRPSRQLMTVDTVARTTLRVLHEEGKRGFVGSLRTYLTFFFPNSGRIPPILGRSSASLSNKSRSSKKARHSSAAASLTWLKPLLDLSLRVLSRPGAPLSRGAQV